MRAHNQLYKYTKNTHHHVRMLSCAFIFLLHEKHPPIRVQIIYDTDVFFPFAMISVCVRFASDFTYKSSVFCTFFSMAFCPDYFTTAFKLSSYELATAYAWRWMDGLRTGKCADGLSNSRFGPHTKRSIWGIKMFFHYFHLFKNCNFDGFKLPTIPFSCLINKKNQCFWYFSTLTLKKCF